MRIKSKETHAAQTVSAYNIHRISDGKQRLILYITKDFDVRFLSGEALRALSPEVLLICIHMKLQEFIGFTYEKLQNRQSF